MCGGILGLGFTSQRCANDVGGGVTALLEHDSDSDYTPSDEFEGLDPAASSSMHWSNGDIKHQSMYERCAQVDASLDVSVESFDETLQEVRHLLQGVINKRARTRLRRRRSVKTGAECDDVIDL